MGMAMPTLRQSMQWFLAVEDDQLRAPALRGGPALMEAALADGLIDPPKADSFALAILALHERGMLHIEYSLLSTDQGARIFRGQPSYHLEQAASFHSLSVGREWLSDPAGGALISIQGGTGHQIAAGDIHNTTIVHVLAAMERAVDEIDAPPAVKEEAHGWVRALRAAARIGAVTAHETASSVLAKALAQALHLPPG